MRCYAVTSSAFGRQDAKGIPGHSRSPRNRHQWSKGKRRVDCLALLEGSERKPHGYVSEKLSSFGRKVPLATPPCVLACRLFRTRHSPYSYGVFHTCLQSAMPSRMPAAMAGLVAAVWSWPIVLPLRYARLAGVDCRFMATHSLRRRFHPVTRARPFALPRPDEARQPPPGRA